MTDFYQTRMGKTYYDHTLPTIAKELKRLNDLLERLVVVAEKGAGEKADDENG